MGRAGKASALWKKNRYKKTTITIVAVLLVFGFFYTIWQVLNSPAKGTVKVTQSTPQSRQKLPEYTTLENDYFKLDYSEKYSSAPVAASGGEVVNYAYQQKIDDPSETPQGSLSIILRAAPAGGITLDKDYQKYLKLPKDYKFSNKYYQGEAVDLAIKQTGGTDQVALWLHGPYVLAITMAKTKDNKNLDAELKDILSSVQWKQN